MTVPHTFGGNPLDRAAVQRRDPDWINAQLERADTRILALWRLNIPIVEGDAPHLAWVGPEAVAQRDDGTTPVSIYVPIDDEHTLHMGIEWHPSKPVPGSRYPSMALPEEPGTLVDGMGPMKPEQQGKYFADWWSVAGPDTDFLMDLEAKKKNFTGIPAVRLQDAAVIWSMGPIMDRTAEHLGTSDAAIIRVRRKLIAAAKALRDHGTVPPGVDDPTLYTVRSCNVSLPAGSDWEEALGDWLHARTIKYPGGNTVARRN